MTSLTSKPCSSHPDNPRILQILIQTNRLPSAQPNSHIFGGDSFLLNRANALLINLTVKSTWEQPERSEGNIERVRPQGKIVQLRQPSRGRLNL